MDYDLKMYETGEQMLNFGFFKRMNPGQQQAMLDYYRPIYADLQQQNPQGRDLIEWKYQRYMRDYLATAASLDRNIGRALDYLDKHGLAQNTIVIYISDQGFYLGEHGWFDKRFMYEESFRTPLLVRYPAEVKPGTVNRQLVMNLDIGPTLLDMAGLPAPAEMQGRSMRPQLRNPRKKGREAMYYHYYENGEHAVSPHFGISTGRYKLIRFYEKVEGWELYDLERDPAENSNVINDKRYQKTRRRLEKRLAQLIRKYDDAEAAEIMVRPVGPKAF
jgi:arylsulfatase A-like enzyme